MCICMLCVVFECVWEMCSILWFAHFQWYNMWILEVSGGIWACSCACIQKILISVRIHWTKCVAYSVPHCVKIMRIEFVGIRRVWEKAIWSHKIHNFIKKQVSLQDTYTNTRRGKMGREKKYWYVIQKVVGIMRIMVAHMNRCMWVRLVLSVVPGSDFVGNVRHITNLKINRKEGKKEWTNWIDEIFRC